MTAPTRFADPQARQALQARVAARLVIGLSERAEALPHDLAERLRVARQQAVARSRQARQRVPLSGPAAGVLTVGSARGAALLAQPSPWWQRAASLLPLALLVLGLLMIEQRAEQEQVHAAAEVDALLLADDLPPDAYSDPGFAEFLRSPPPP
jgi:hypothetical protein